MNKQTGRNEKYPKEIITWKRGDKVPQWLSDVCNIIKVDEKGEPELDIRESGDGYELITSGTNQVIVKVAHKDDFVCFGDRKIFTLTKKQKELLYD